MGLFFFLRTLSFTSSSAPMNFPTAAITPAPSFPLAQACLIIPYAALAAAMLSRMAIVLPSSYVNYEGENERKFLLIIFQKISQCRPEYNLLCEDTLCKSLSSLLVA